MRAIAEQMGFVGAFGVALLCTGVVNAQPSGVDKATAQTLFEEGRRLAQEGRYTDACPKFAESLRLDEGAGTMFNLADCQEKLGRTATAWALFLEVAGRLKVEGQAAREQAARERATALTPRLRRLTVVVPADSRVEGLRITLDDSALGGASWGQAIPVDPGEHVVVAEADGRESWRRTVEAGGEGVGVEVTVPMLAQSPPTPAQPTESPMPASSVLIPSQAAPHTARTGPTDDTGASDGSSQRFAGWIVGGVGVVGLGASVVLGLRAKSIYSDANTDCDGNVCSQEGLDRRQDAKSLGNIATAAGGLGIAALVGGTVMVLTAPATQEASNDGTGIASRLVVGPGSVCWAGEW